MSYPKSKEITTTARRVYDEIRRAPNSTSAELQTATGVCDQNFRGAIRALRRREMIIRTKDVATGKTKYKSTLQ